MTSESVPVLSAEEERRLAGMREVAAAAQPGDIAALWSSENDYRWLLTVTDRLATALAGKGAAMASMERELTRNG